MATVGVVPVPPRWGQRTSRRCRSDVPFSFHLTNRYRGTAMLTAGQVLDRYFLEVRCMLVEIAATLDRHDQAAGNNGQGTPDRDARLEKIFASLEMLAERKATPDRAERLLTLYSDLD